MLVAERFAGLPKDFFAFFRELKLHNERSWFEANKPRFRDSVQMPMSAFIAAMAPQLRRVSKQFTAASILLLEKQGKLRLDDDVRKYIPELPDYGENITVLQLLNHTSGLRDYVSLFQLAGIHFDNVTTDDDALGIIARQKGLNFSPGSDWQYSNSGYLLSP